MDYISVSMRAYQDEAARVVDQALEMVSEQEYAFIAEPGSIQTERTLDILREYAQKYRPEVIILVGIGGSHLGAQALYNSVVNCPDTCYAQLLSVTSIDSSSCLSAYQQARDIILSDKSVVVAIVTKTGQTFETAAHAQGLYQLMTTLGKQDRVVVITDQGGVLAQLARAQNLLVATLPENLGGRYSVMSAAGCGVLELCGIDTRPVRQAAAQVSWSDVRESTIFWYTAWLAGYRVYDIFTFMPSCEQLGQWCRQLVGESLGKQGRGFLPTVSLGSQDLHSVVQYYLDGPKMVATQFVIPSRYIHTDIIQTGFFSQTAHLPPNMSLGMLQDTIIQGVLQAYQESDCPYLVYRLEPTQIASVSSWMQERMCETILLGQCFQVNPLDQPAVQQYKLRTRKLWR